MHKKQAIELAQSTLSAPIQSPQHPSDFPRRIICLTDETTETLYLLGEEDRIVGVSGFTTRPTEARSKPRVSAFRDANLDAILDLKPDLILTFSDVQAEITRNLVLRGATVLNFNQRTIAEIFDMISVLARLIGKPNEGQALIEKLQSGLREIEDSVQKFPYRPRAFFEEWNDPLISGIRWVEELVAIAGGNPIFPELRDCGKAQDRVVDPSAVAARDPEVILASWCGMKVDIDAIRLRPSWASTSAARNNHIYEIPSSCILQPGPAALTEGVRQLHTILARVVHADVAPEPKPNQIGDPCLL
ncbi:MAG TPA: cobalamin-binding protein [Terracidiphilus sp.]|jgi:iron complex transport system substrate-binding protein|nr:cobalamin-binding protein [Terracidiphilus sp.]